MKNDLSVEKMDLLYTVIKDTYINFDQDDYCDDPQELFKNDYKCECLGCKQYKNLYKAYFIIKNLTN